MTGRSDTGHLDLPRMRAGGLNAQVFAIWTDPVRYGPNERATFVHRSLDAFDRIVARARGLVRVTNPDELARAVAVGRVAGILGVEGGHALEGDIDNLDRFFKRGVRVLTLTWNNSNPFARSCMSRDGRRRGLTRLGREAVKRMNRLGIVIDLSHASDKTFLDVLDASTAPIICSHSACRALRRFPRNLTDRQLQALGKAGGVIGIVFLPYFISRDYCRVSIEDVLDHVAHAASVAGIDAVALGSDFDGFDDPPVKGLEDVTRLPALTAGLARRGFPPGAIRGILGGNFLRVWRRVTATGPARQPA
jgi:membrane dipeptidase